MRNPKNEKMELFSENSTLPMSLIIVLTLWDIVWKLVAFWKSARNNHLAWFICIAIFNTVGILPIIYILKYRKKKETIEKRNASE